MSAAESVRVYRADLDDDGEIRVLEFVARRTEKRVRLTDAGVVHAVPHEDLEGAGYSWTERAALEELRNRLDQEVEEIQRVANENAKRWLVLKRGVDAIGSRLTTGQVTS